MDRRKFVKAAALATVPIILKSCDWPQDNTPYSVEVLTDAATGHLVREANSFEQEKAIDVEYLIVGGGVAGMTAAYQLQGRDFLLCELSDRLGGSSSAVEYQGMGISQGAHYDLSYPEGYGEEALAFLEDLGIVAYQPWRSAWGFVEQQHIIAHRRKNRCYAHGEFRKDVLPEGETKDRFLSLLADYKGMMNLPSRLIDGSLRHLNDLTFFDFLKKNIALDESLVTGLDYHMKDDYGAGCRSVSALAGIHYFMCRPYYTEVVELYSPPEGNYRFIANMAKNINQEQLLTQHLVSSIRADKQGFVVEVVDGKRRKKKSVKARKIIYAGQKHALKYIYPEDYRLFAQQESAPWLVVNVVVEGLLPQPAYWQNEMLTHDSSFMGFVDSGSQHTPGSNHRVLTAYYCLPASSRADLLRVEADKGMLAKATLGHISDYFGEDITGKVKQVFIKAMGHAMPIPSPGYLFDDKNQHRSNKALVYAGVDNARLPLFLEAVDSGLEAVKLLKGI
jgi:protoporphyrinogen oxidase